MSAARTAVKASAILVLVGLFGFWLAVKQNWLGQPPSHGQIQGKTLPTAQVIARQQAQQVVSDNADKQILFGDFHVHTTYSTDAFLWSLPMTGGRGVHPIADACDFARYCSGLDFWGITDHAEASTPRRWQETKDSIRQCQALAGDTDNPDLLAFVGFEWTQVGNLPDNHYGHKNVIFKGLADEDIAARPIAASGLASDVLRRTMQPFPPALALTEGLEIERYLDFNAFLAEIRSIPSCDPALPSGELPADCFESAATPGELADRLAQQSLQPLIIPHGTSWGFYTPPGTTLDKQLKPGMRPEAFGLVEVMSGHGNSEEYRPWRAILQSDDGNQGRCPPPSDNFLPSCWRAGQIIEQRCSEQGLPTAECAQRAERARWYYANMGVAGHLAVDGESPEDWLDAGQCRDCFQPPFNHRPGTSVQYGLAISDFSLGADQPLRFTWGFIASSDNHRARPGTGYKPVDRMVTTEASGPVNDRWARRIYGEDEPPSADPRFVNRDELGRMAGFQLTEMERQSSFWLTGGLAAAHVSARNRDALWDAFQTREVYGTSGPKMLLWFDQLAGDQRYPMGSQRQETDTPRFRVHAVGGFEQQPGCPDYAAAGLGAERLQQLCSGECDHPGDRRHPITRIEVVRIQPQAFPNESVNGLIEDPWKVLDCPEDPDGMRGCTVSFDDPDYPEQARDTTYYVRAIQAPTDAINAENLRCEYDAEGNCIRVNPCYGDFRTNPSDNCSSPTEHRAWSSPIYLQHPASGGRSNDAQ